MNTLQDMHEVGEGPAGYLLVAGLQEPGAAQVQRALMSEGACQQHKTPAAHHQVININNE